MLDLLEPKGLVLVFGSDMNITSCHDGDGKSNVISRIDSLAGANKFALAETRKQSSSEINGDKNITTRHLSSLTTLHKLCVTNVTYRQIM